ncbi:MAG: TetR/AcrR family transcriptional regulator [Actinomycetota bacterium]|nr:TetR/AcrR family transcriptional regulator [Actinomycetota bacterium]
MVAESNIQSPGTDTRDRILEGALHAIGTNGVRSLSMRKIAEAAGVSRGTVYHYFHNTNEVLRAVSTYDQRRFDEGAARALANAGTPDKQLFAFLDYCYRYLTLHPTRWMVEHEPRFLLRYLEEQIPHMSARLEKSLRSALAEAPAVRKGRLTSAELADLAVRMLISAYLLPAADPTTPLKAIVELVMDPPDAGPSHPDKAPRRRPVKSTRARRGT